MAKARRKRCSQRELPPPDPAFAEALVARRGALVRQAAGRFASVADAEDLAHDTILRAWRNRDLFQPGTNMAGWTATILFNLGVNASRQRSRAEVLTDPDNLARIAPAADPEPEVDENAAQMITDALAAIPVRYRVPVYLCDACDATYDEVHRATGVPLGTVMSRLFRGRRLLRAALRDLAADYGIREAA